MIHVFVVLVKSTRSVVVNKMTFEELKNFIKLEDTRLAKCYGVYSDKEKEVFSHSVKLTEEVGELCSEVLSKYSRQRKGKTEAYNEEKLAEELVDVIIVASLLANSLNIDVETTLKKKMEKIERRHKENDEIR